MSTPFSIVRDINGYNGFGLMPADDKFSMLLASNVEQHFNVPTNSEDWIAIFSYTPGSSVWVAINNGSASIPFGAVSTTNSELNPTARHVKGGQLISLITSDSTSDQVGVALYTLSNGQNMGAM